MRIKIPAGARPATTFAAEGGRHWTLYELPTAEGKHSSTFLWLPFKLMEPSSTPKQWGRQRSFWLGWTPIGMRLRRDRDGARLRAQDPALYEAVDAFLRATYTRGWLLETGGVTDAEIDAEVARLALAAEMRGGKPRGA